MALKYALIGHNLSLELLYENLPHFKGKPIEFIKKELLKLEPQKVTDLIGVKSKNGKEISGHGYSIHLLPEQFYEVDRKLILEKIKTACRLAISNNVDIIALGAFTAPASNYGLDLLDEFNNVAITTGNSYTAAETIEMVKMAAKSINLDLKQCIVTIVGATGSIGSVCSHILAGMVKNLFLSARNIKKLKLIENKINNNYPNKATVETDIVKAVKKSNIIIFATSAHYALIDSQDFNPGSLVVDVSIPKNVALNNGKLRKDILIIDGGMMRPPGDYKNTDYAIGLPVGIAPACLCESMILALENKKENYTVGLNMTTEQVKNIYDLGQTHGFQLAGFLSFGKTIPSATVGKIKTSIENNI